MSIARTLADLFLGVLGRVIPAVIEKPSVRTARRAATVAASERASEEAIRKLLEKTKRR